MPIFALLVATLASASQPDDAPVIVTGYAWAPFVSPAGEPFRSRSPSDDPFARWFHQADRNNDGSLTADELDADAARFFEALDSNDDGEIDSDEIVAYERQIAPEVQVNSDWKRTRQEAAAERSQEDSKGGRKRRRDNGIDGYQIDGLQGAARYGLLNLPQPVAGADSDFNRRITRDEFRRAAIYRFRLLDSSGRGNLSFADLEARIPSRPKSGRRAKRPKTNVDTRIGVPLPQGD